MMERLHEIRTRMSRLRPLRIVLALGLFLAGTASAGLHDESSGLAAFPGQDANEVGFSELHREQGYAALFEGDASPLLRLPFQSLGGAEAGISYGPLLRYRQSDVLGFSANDRLEAGGYLAWRRGAWYLQGSALGGDPLNGEAGLFGLSGSYALQSGERLTLTFSGSATYAGDDYLRQRVLVDPGLTGLPLDGRGLGNLGLGLNASYQIGTDWSLVGMFGVHHTLAEGGLGGVDEGTRFRAGAALSLDF
jgi:hypothetical protein